MYYHGASYTSAHSSNLKVSIHQVDATVDDFIDVVEGNRVYVPMVRTPFLLSLICADLL